MPKTLILYHYYAPDDVVSATHFTNLCEGLSQRDWEVETWPANRACHGSTTYPTKPETVNNVSVRRVWRLPLPQHSFFGRILNALWMLKAWWLRLLFTPSYRPDVILIGTDPLFSVALAPWLKLLRPKTKIAHWCFDLYPEAAVADGAVKRNGFLVRLTGSLAKRGYANCDLVVDLGPCMKKRLEEYPGKKRTTLTPWALEEPHKPSEADPSERKELFGEAKLGLLYSGNLGRAHDFYLTLKLARMLRESAVFNYSARGGRMEELRRVALPEDRNLRFGSFAPPEKLSARLSAPDVHIVSLKAEWTGTVVPSKFFGALAVGRPVLFEGPAESSIARWIEEYKVGWVLRADNLNGIAEQLLRFSGNPKAKREMFDRCHATYRDHLSRGKIIERWDAELRAI